MSKNNLILLEGTPGSGKSTAAVYLQGFLENKSPYTHLWREGDFDHPADFEGVACLNGAGYRDVLLRYPELSVLFQEHLTTALVGAGLYWNIIQFIP